MRGMNRQQLYLVGQLPLPYNHGVGQRLRSLGAQMGPTPFKSVNEVRCARAIKAYKSEHLYFCRELALHVGAKIK